jgi:hypothetical protein
MGDPSAPLGMPGSRNREAEFWAAEAAIKTSERAA